jgi:hypothetical protein
MAALGVAIAAMGLAVAFGLTTRGARPAWAKNGMSAATRNFPAQLAASAPAAPTPDMAPPQVKESIPAPPLERQVTTDVTPRRDNPVRTRTDGVKTGTTPIKNETKPPAASSCNGDLMCEMRRATRG